jgi:hypothetical protein
MKIPLVLPVEGCWEVAKGRIASVAFFDALAEAFPEATTAYVEGTSIEPDVATAFGRLSEAGAYLPKSQTIWPRSRQFRCCFNPAFCSELSALAAVHAEPELFDHFFLYAGDRPILEWPDAFANCIWISSSVAEDRVASLARHFGLPYRYER